jgi:hypothetical protein
MTATSTREPSHSNDTVDSTLASGIKNRLPCHSFPLPHSTSWAISFTSFATHTLLAANGSGPRPCGKWSRGPKTGLKKEVDVVHLHAGLDD